MMQSYCTEALVVTHTHMLLLCVPFYWSSATRKGASRRRNHAEPGPSRVYSRCRDLVRRKLPHCCIIQESYGATHYCSFVRVHERHLRATKLPCLRHAEMEEHVLLRSKSRRSAILWALLLGGPNLNRKVIYSAVQQTQTLFQDLFVLLGRWPQPISDPNCLAQPPTGGLY